MRLQDLRGVVALHDKLESINNKIDFISKVRLSEEAADFLGIHLAGEVRDMARRTALKLLARERNDVLQSLKRYGVVFDEDEE